MDELRFTISSITTCDEVDRDDFQWAVVGEPRQITSLDIAVDAVVGERHEEGNRRHRFAAFNQEWVHDGALNVTRQKQAQEDVVDQVELRVLQIAENEDGNDHGGQVLHEPRDPGRDEEAERAGSIPTVCGG